MTGTREIALLSHTNDVVGRQSYLIGYLVEAWRRSGIEIVELHGTNHYETADVLIQHVNRTIVPVNYLAFCKRYPVVINGRVHDISKR